ncbi:hypothetical protein BDP55DRAFT_269092 [Colletotrichum godetiae]|uniref:Wac domain-containing protein n=1 Tax=Colletotrichum godetiae TaxID=1209918 RepID=A0AAJ0AWH5_9PEZI|nr:uncharacterized protein BDP55DRAFT_269092 [Colletotrichum godetiae]KAK1691619.1 hypothetical protein BDP55DRAFT_269092 [Colletotrichum godetiae]
MTTQTDTVVLWNDFLRNYNHENKLFKTEFDSLRQSLQSLEQRAIATERQVGDRLDRFESRARSTEQRIEDRLDRFENRLDHFEKRAIDSEQRRAESLQIAASLRNHTIRIPTLRIYPLVAFDLERGIVEPESEWFPKNANEFYSLRNPKTARQRRMLKYLVEFYDVSQHIDASGDSSDSGSQADVIQDPETAVTMLEGVLGLNEDNFIHFRRHVEESSRRLAPTAGKRFQTEEHERRTRPEVCQSSVLPLRVQMESISRHLPAEPQLASPPPKAQSYESEDAHISWGSRQTPSDQRQTVNGLAAHVRKMKKLTQEQQGSEENKRESDGSESPTAAFTSSERG